MYIKIPPRLTAQQNIMGDLFGGLRSGIQFPEVVMNQGPLPGAGPLPRPLHDTPDARINYNSSLLGDLNPYAYGGPGYLSSQNAYLNIPHKIQKIVPVVYLPEARPGATDFFDVSHPIDDGDLAFVMRLDRNSLFCTGLKNGDMRRAGLGTAVDPLINLCTLNYILSGVQYGVTDRPGDLWQELLFNLDRVRFGKAVGKSSRDYVADPLNLGDIIHIVRHCVKPFGVTRGSERQGGQNESNMSPATWPVSFVVSLTIDGKESNVVNLWHHKDLSAGDDLVLRLKLMPLRPYTLNHYYKGVKRQNWAFPPDQAGRERYAWQLVPDLFHIEGPRQDEVKLMEARMAMIEPRFRMLRGFSSGGNPGGRMYTIRSDVPWQDLGYWHVGRSQVMTAKYGIEEYWHNDLANTLRTNHLDITFQPVFHRTPVMIDPPLLGMHELRIGDELDCCSDDDDLEDCEGGGWEPSLGLERLEPDAPWHDEGNIGDDSSQGDFFGMFEPVRAPPPRGEEGDIGTLEFTDDPAPGTAVAPADGADTAPLLPVPGLGPKAAGGKPAAKPAAGPASKRARSIGGSLLKADGTSEPSMVGML